MAQSNAVQDQPSMEDILASIRRIIDEGGEVKAPANTNVVRDIPAVQPPKPAERPVPSNSLRAEPRTAVRAAPGDIDAPSEAQQYKDDPKALSGLMDIKPETLKVNGKYENRFTETDRTAFEEVASVLSASTGTVRPAIAQPAASAPLRAVPNPVGTGQGGSLTSRHASRNVAMSFESLSEALQREAGRNLPEVAEEILKPMLSDWLDNNLPSMVERLVRQEIERIARGD